MRRLGRLPLGVLAALLLGANTYAVVPATPILWNATITSSGSQVVVQIPAVEADLVWNVVGTPSGQSPTLVFTLTAVDPLNTGTTMTGDTSPVSTATITSASSGVLQFIPVRSSAVKVSWTVGGATPSFGGVYATMAIKNPLKY